MSTQTRWGGDNPPHIIITFSGLWDARDLHTAYEERCALLKAHPTEFVVTLVDMSNTLYVPPNVVTQIHQFGKYLENDHNPIVYVRMPSLAYDFAMVLFRHYPKIQESAHFVDSMDEALEIVDTAQYWR